MKNKNLWMMLSALLMTVFSFSLRAGSPTASKELFDWTPFGDSKMLDLFYDALQDGRNYPTDQEMIDVFGFDIEFARSHVRQREVMYNQEKQLNPAINPKRKVWMNLPTGVGKDIGGYPSSAFSDDVYSMWNYTHLFGAWNHGMFQAPGVWADAAHKHGTAMFSGIKFFESWTPGSGDKDYSALIGQKNADGSFKYAEPLINILMYLGLDGINYNWEDGSYRDDDVIAFHKELFRIADEKGYENFHIGLYTSVSTLTSAGINSLYYGHKPEEKTIDLMLNYASGDFAYSNTPTSIASAKSVGQTDGLYQGVWIVTMDRAWPAMDTEARKEANLCLWGEHGQSRFMSYNSGADGYDFQENYQKLLERAFSGGNRNPADLPALTNSGNNWEQVGDKEPLSTFGGLATMIAERTTIQGQLPFVTNFQLGNGERYNYKGKKAFGNWYNMGAQDYQPTYRWLVYKSGTTDVDYSIQPRFTHRDAYNGGSTLELSGKATAAGNDIILYRTDLEISALNPIVNLAVKTYKEGETPTNLSVILRKKDDSTWYEIPYGSTADKTWEEKTLEMTGFEQGDVVEYIGLRVKAEGSDVENYQIYVGKLALMDDREVEVAEVENLIVEVKEETTKSMSLKLNWKITPFEISTLATEQGLVYNDEANVDHFEILYKNGEDGSVKAVGRTTSWSAFVGNIIFEDMTSVDEPYIGVRAVSIDGKSYSHPNWVQVTRADATQLPEFVDDRYCKSDMNPAAEGANVARVQRYLTEVKTIGLEDNLNFTSNSPVEDGTQYLDATSYSFTANQGDTFDFFFKAVDTSTGFGATDGLRYCFAKAYIDWDNNGEFDAEEELVFDLGKVRAATPEFETTGVTQSFTVPEDAAPGAVRLRIVFSDAWFAHPGPCGQTAKGFSIDFTMNVTGDNPGRVTEDSRDAGTPDEPDRINDENPNASDGTGVSQISKGDYTFFYPNPATDLIHFEAAEQVWIYTLEGKLVHSQKGYLENVGIDHLDDGVYLVKMLNNNVIRSQKLIKQ